MKSKKKSVLLDLAIGVALVFAVGLGLCPSASGAEWQRMDSPTNHLLRDVWGTSCNKVFAVSYCDASGNAPGGQILHHDGNSWQIAAVFSDKYLTAIWGSSSSDIWAVGYEGAILRCLNGEWQVWTQQTPIPSGEHFHDVWGFGPQDIWLVGESPIYAGQNQGIIRHWDGQQWSSPTLVSMASGAETQLNGVGGRGPAEVYAVGASAGPGSCFVFNGSVWNEVTPWGGEGAVQVWGTDTHLFVAALRWGHLNGNNWQWEGSTVGGLYSVSGTTAENVYMVGHAGRIIHFDGTQWSEMASGTTENLYGVWASETGTVFAVGTNGTILRLVESVEAPDMVYIPGGTFQMGDSFNEGDSRERPVHTVTLDSFCMGKYEISNSLYCAYLNSAQAQGLITVTSGVVYKVGSGTSYPYCRTSASFTESQIAFSGGLFSVLTKSGRHMGNDPISSVTWYGTVAYCNWLSQQEDREQCYNLSTWNCDFTKNGYRLATEAEWEYAARGGLAGKRFPWGDDIYHTQANYNSSDSYSYDKGPTRGFHPMWNDGIYPYTSPVGSFAGNGYGLCDMAGNAWEWCNDWFGYYSSSPANNPTGPTSGSYRTLRGGCWHNLADICRVTYRSYGRSPSNINDIYGFRIVRSANRPPSAEAGEGESVHPGGSVTLDGSGSTDPDGNYPLTYAWSMVSKPSASLAELVNGDTVGPTLTPDLMGDYVIQLIVTDSLGMDSEPDTVIVSTWNTAPVADAGNDQQTTELGAPVQLNGSASYDDEGDPITYLWTLVEGPSGSIATLDDPASVTPMFVPDVYGDYKFSLLVTDIFGAVSASREVTISFDNIRPVANAGGSQAVYLGEVVTLDGSASDDGNGDPLTFRWCFVSTPDGSTATIADPAAEVTSFVPDLPGTYVVSLVVNDGLLDSDADNVTIMVTLIKDAVTDILQQSIEVVNLLPPEDWKNDNLTKALVNKINNAVLMQIEIGAYQEAIDKLQNDVLKRIDGCALGGEPDKNDWLTTCEAQEEVYPLIIEAIELLEQLIG